MDPLTDQTPCDSAAGGPAERALRRPLLATVDGQWSFGQWLDGQQDALFGWCLQHTGDRVDPGDFTAMAMAVQREDGARALSEWLLWAALMLAREAAAPRQADPAFAAAAAARLAPRLQLLLALAQQGRLHSSEVMALLACPLATADERLAALARPRLPALSGEAA